MDRAVIPSKKSAPSPANHLILRPAEPGPVADTVAWFRFVTKSTTPDLGTRWLDRRQRGRALPAAELLHLPQVDAIRS